MTKKNDLIFDVLQVVSWIAFVGLCIEAGAIVFNFIFSYFKPIVAQNLYRGLDLSELYQNHFPHFIAVMSFIVVIAIMKAYLFYLVVRIFMKLDLSNPFSRDIATLIEKISYEAFAIAIVSIVAQQYTKRLLHTGYEVSHAHKYWGDIAAFLMMAAIVYIISKIFDKGIQIQEENDLTV